VVAKLWKRDSSISSTLIRGGAAPRLREEDDNGWGVIKNQILCLGQRGEPKRVLKKGKAIIYTVAGGGGEGNMSSAWFVVYKKLNSSSFTVGKRTSTEMERELRPERI